MLLAYATVSLQFTWLCDRKRNPIVIKRPVTTRRLTICSTSILNLLISKGKGRALCLENRAAILLWNVKEPNSSMVTPTLRKKLLIANIKMVGRAEARDQPFLLFKKLVPREDPCWDALLAWIMRSAVYVNPLSRVSSCHPLFCRLPVIVRDAGSFSLQQIGLFFFLGTAFPQWHSTSHIPMHGWSSKCWHFSGAGTLMRKSRGAWL